MAIRIEIQEQRIIFVGHGIERSGDLLAVLYNLVAVILTERGGPTLFYSGTIL